MILVSDEIVEAIDCSTHDNNDVEMGEEQQSEIQARLAMMEELLEEQDEASSSVATRNRSCPATMFETDIFDDDGSSCSSSSSEDGTYARSESLTDQANVRNSSSTIVVSNTTELARPPTNNFKFQRFSDWTICWSH